MSYFLNFYELTLAVLSRRFLNIQRIFREYLSYPQRRSRSLESSYKMGLLFTFGGPEENRVEYIKKLLLQNENTRCGGLRDNNHRRNLDLFFTT